MYVCMDVCVDVCMNVCMYDCVEVGFEVLSRTLWRLALAEVPPDEDEFITLWVSIVSYCNTYGRPASEKQTSSFSSYPDPHEQHPSIPVSNHPFLNKLFHTKHK